VGPLAGLTGLKELGLGGNNIADIAALSNLPMLKRLSLDRNQITDIGALSDLTDLIVLWLDDNDIVDISPLSGLHKLGEVGESTDWWLEERGDTKICLGLSNNQIADIGPLVDNEGLGEGDGIDLRGNPLSGDSLEVYLPQLEDRGVTVLRD